MAEKKPKLADGQNGTTGTIPVEPPEWNHGVAECVTPGPDGRTTLVFVSPRGKLLEVHFGGDEVPATMLWGINWQEVNTLLGKLLTFADSANPDPEQRKAQKDMIRQIVGEWVDIVATDAEYDSRENNDLPMRMHIGGSIPSDPRKDSYRGG